MTKDNALQRIDSHEKLCRIMQKQTHDKIHKLESQITRVERILLVSMGAVITGMGGCLLYTSPSPRDGLLSRMPSSA